LEFFGVGAVKCYEVEDMICYYLTICYLLVDLSCHITWSGHTDQYCRPALPF